MKQKKLMIIYTLFIAHKFSAAEPSTVTFSSIGAVENGKIAFIKPSIRKIIEMDLNGKITWEFSIPRKYSKIDFSISGGADINWIEKTDSFIVAIPKVGAIEVNRKGEVIWEYLTEEISHDIDLLEDDTLIFVNGWDSDSQHIFTRIDRSGKIIERYTLGDFGISKSERKLNFSNEFYSNTHANAVQRLGEREYLISLRNYNKAIIIKSGKVVSKIENVRSIHDPVDLKDGIYFIRQDGPYSQRIVRLNKQTQERAPLFSTTDTSMTPMRTLEPLRNGNFLITGSSTIAQISKDGDLVWSVKLNNFQHQVLSTTSNRDFIYKAAFVYK
jgi:hypothetical protein